MAFVHLGTSVVPKDTTTPNEVDKNTTVAPTTKVNTASLSSIVEEPGVITTNVHVNDQLSSANNNNAQCQAEKASALLQDVKNVQDETDHVHSPTLPPHNKGNLAEPNPIINEQMSLDNSLVAAAATAESQQPATAIILQTVESNTSTASNTEDTKPKLIQPTVVRKEKSIKTNSQQSQSQSPTTQQQATQKKADVDEGKAGISSGNFFT